MAIARVRNIVNRECLLIQSYQLFAISYQLFRRKTDHFSE